MSRESRVERLLLLVGGKRLGGGLKMSIGWSILDKLRIQIEL